MLNKLGATNVLWELCWRAVYMIGVHSKIFGTALSSQFGLVYLFHKSSAWQYSIVKGDWICFSYNYLSTFKVQGVCSRLFSHSFLKTTEFKHFVPLIFSFGVTYGDIKIPWDILLYYFEALQSATWWCIPSLMDGNLALCHSLQAQSLLITGLDFSTW